MEQIFGPRRSRETRKPEVVCPPLFFYICRHCGNIYQSITENKNFLPQCCGSSMERMHPCDASTMSSKISIYYKIIGGYNENAVKVSWQSHQADINVAWLYLRTFTGGMLKYVTNLQKSSFTFALADEDAYVYCDEDPCLECTFRCKRGFEIYVALTNNFLIKLPLEKMTANWQS